MIIVNLTLDEKKNQRLTLITAAIGFIGSYIFHTRLFCHDVGSFYELIVGIARTVVATIANFGSGNEYSALMGEEGFASNALMPALYWVIILAARFTTANVIVLTLGRRLIEELRRMCAAKRRRRLIIFGINEDSLAFAAKARDHHGVRRHLIFVDQNPDEEKKERVRKLDAALLDSGDNTGTLEKRISHYCRKALSRQNNSSVESVFPHVWK